MNPRSFAASFIEDSLGLVRGSLARDAVPSSLVERIASVMRGGPPPDIASPSIERDLLALLRGVERSAVEERGYFVRKARWPGAASFAVCLTHDVDNISRPAEHIRRVKDRFTEEDLLRAERGEISLYNNLELIGAKEAEAGYRSSFYFMAFEYPLAQVAEVSRRLAGRGWDIGLHGDFGTHDSLEKMKEAAGRLEEAMGFRPLGLREHYLRFDFDRSWQVMEDAGFDYDSTLGTTDRIGFKLGLAAPFHPPDSGWKPMRLLELPLVLMETTLWGYLKRSEAQGFADVVASMRAVEGVEGLFTLLWHQESVRMKGGRIYWKVLEEVGRRGCFVGSGAQISSWWRAREVPLVQKGNLITIGGEPPMGLVLNLSLAKGRKPRVHSGKIRTRGGGYLVEVKGRDFRLEVD